MLTNSRNKLNIMLFNPLMRSTAVLLAICLGYVSAAAATATPEQLYQSGKKALNVEDFQSAIDGFHQLQQRYPGHPFGQRALLDLAYAYYRLGNYALARTEAERFIDTNPDHPQLPFAYYVAGLTHYTSSLKMVSSDPARANDAGQEALRYFGLLTERFPESEYATHAKLRSHYLLEKLAASQHEMGSITAITPITADFGSDKEIKKEAWILAQLPTRYTLQLFSSPNLISMLRMVDEHGLSSQAMIYEIQRHNGIIYTLLYGLFDSERVAMDIGSRLPREILNIQPSIKPLSEIQRQISENRTPTEETRLSPIDRIEVEQTTTETAKVAPIVEKAHPGSVKSKPVAKTGQLVNEWVMAQPPLHYTIQLAGMGRERSVQRFIREHPSEKTIAYYHGLRKDKEWYGVIHGAYPSLKQAKKAAAELRTELGIDPPWIRRIRAIQKSIQDLKK